MRLDAVRSPAVTKSVVRSMSLEPMIVMVLALVGALGTLVVPVFSATEPVPFALIVTA